MRSSSAFACRISADMSRSFLFSIFALLERVVSELPAYQTGERLFGGMQEAFHA